MRSFVEVVNQTRGQVLLTDRETDERQRLREQQAQERTNRAIQARVARVDSAHEEAIPTLSNAWRFVARTLITRNPQPDTLLVNRAAYLEEMHRIALEEESPIASLAKLITTFDKSVSWRTSNQELLARHAYPAWDMMAPITFIKGGNSGKPGEPQDYTRARMFFGSDGRIYHRGNGSIEGWYFHGQTHQGVGLTAVAPSLALQAGQRLQRIGGDNPEGLDNYIDNYEEVMTGLANLVVKHGL